MNSFTTTTILFTPSSSSSSLYSSLSSAHSHPQQLSSPSSTKTLFHNPISIPQQYQQYEHNTSFNTSLSSPPTNAIAPSNKPNRHSLPKSSNIWQQHQQQMQQQQEQHQQLHNYQQQQQLGIQSQKPHSAPSSPLFPLTSGGRGAGLLPRLSLDTSQERLQQKPATVIQHGDQSYLKLFSPTLVESPVSYLDEKQQIADKKMWENGPDEAFQRQLDIERREACKARSRQQLRGLLLGLWLGFLMGLLVLQQTSAKVFIPAHLARHDTSPLMLFTVLMSFIAVYRSGTRCIMTAIATCVAVLTCFATLVVNQTRYSPEFIVYRSVGGDSALSSASSSS
ncbi:hypothetical protein BGZ95_000285 [Linnemannia exigua]|uniref:Uncharacterized protein n=1 Tax=Linnemannia exigua TaxID=604196 RepID=A0AAD4H4G4_9FUNG|nr:hypothetical protein BGZ95_000285 [Linnemannia exigua]